MLTPARLLRRLRSLLTRSQRNSELNDELQFHIQMETEKQMRSGCDAATARSRAMKLFGGVEQHREAAHDMRGIRPLEEFLQDMRFAVRTLKRHRLFAGVSALTLAVGIGATTAIFGAVHGVLLAPLPYAHAERLVTIWQTPLNVNGQRDYVPPGVFLDWRAHAHSFSSMASAENRGMDIVTSRGPETLEGAVISENYFETLGTRPLLGRTFRPEEFVKGRGNVVLLSERVWRTLFGADSSLVGRALIMDTVPTIVVGIMPAAVDLPSGQVAWRPKVYLPGERDERTKAYTTVIARLREGVNFETAAREMQSLTATLAYEQAGVARAAKRGTITVLLKDVLFASSRRSLLLLFIAVAFLLLISCANVSSLQLANAVRRKHELTVRVALGADRRRLMRQLFAESLVLAGIGCLASVGVSYGGISLIKFMVPIDLPGIDALHLNMPMLIFSFVLSIATAVMFGTFPMLQAGRSDLAGALAAAGSPRHGGSAARRRVQRLLVGVEMVLAMALLVGAGLLARSFESLLSLGKGFETAGVVDVTLRAWSYYPYTEERIAYVREAVRRLLTIPGVQAAGMTSSLPLSPPIGVDRTQFIAEGQPVVAVNERPSIHVAVATGGYFDALRIAVSRGRVFDLTDDYGSLPVVIVSEAFVRRYWRDSDPLGKHVTFGYMGRPIERTVIGVVADIRHDGLASDPEPMIYLPHTQAATGDVHFVVRSSRPVDLVQQAVRAELLAMNGSMPLAKLTSLDERLSLSLRERRFTLALMSAFSVTALLLAAIGTYGMMAHLTSERTPEIGVRLAIGAKPASVVWLVLRQSIALAALSVLTGASLALAVARLMQSMLYGISALDPATYLGSGALLLGIALFSAWLPARRASTIDPLSVLRAQ